MFKERGGKRLKRGCTKVKKKKKTRTIYVAKPNECRTTGGRLKTTLKVTAVVAFWTRCRKGNWPMPTKTDTNGCTLTGDRQSTKLTSSALWRRSPVRVVPLTAAIIENPKCLLLSRTPVTGAEPPVVKDKSQWRKSNLNVPNTSEETDENAKRHKKPTTLSNFDNHSTPLHVSRSRTGPDFTEGFNRTLAPGGGCLVGVCRIR